MQRGAQSARCHFGATSIKRYVFHAGSGAWPFLSCCSFGVLALCFPILRGRPWPFFPSLEVMFFRFGALALYLSIRGAVLFRSWASSLVALGYLLGGRVRSGPVDGSWLRKKAPPCSVALVLFKNKHSHAAWRSFCIFRLGRRRLAAGLGRTSANPLRLQRQYHFSKNMRSHAAWRSKCSASLWHPRSPVLCFPVSGAWPFLSC